MRPTNKRIVSASGVDYVADEMLLTIVGCQNGDLSCRVAQQTHIHVHGDNVLCLSKILWVF